MPTLNESNSQSGGYYVLPILRNKIKLHFEEQEDQH